MRNTRRFKYILAVTLAVLLLLGFITGVLVSHKLWKIQKNTPYTEIVLTDGTAASGPALEAEAGAAAQGTQQKPAQPQTPTAPQQKPTQTDSPRPQSAPQSSSQSSSSADTEFYANPSSLVADPDGDWTMDADVEIFRASYESETGETTVRSAGGNAVIAPGTANTYEFHLKNNGNIPLDYTTQVEATIKAVVQGATYSVPIQAKLYTSAGEYLLGTDGAYSPMENLTTVTDTGGLSPDHYVRYTLEWCWPFEGDDQLDTMLGNLSAEGDEVIITVKLLVNASANLDAVGGIPQTGDTSNISLWMSVMVCSAFALIFLLLPKRAEEEEAQKL